MTGSKQRLQIGIERFLAGDPLVFEGVMFWQDRNQFLGVSSFSEFVYPESSSADEAASKIARSKFILGKLSSLSPEFSKVAGSMPHRHDFCHDYGKGVIRLAHLENDQLVWEDLK